ncbi:UNVERIFIED_CONTAM: hypothetical protein HDU68_007632 [Siphonaria sp. JEL0065]|nr:hypothetical protein HDU68_007632 [Siphonaria sp. JEL0065]
MKRAAHRLIGKLQEAGLQKQILPVKDTTSYFQNGSKGVFVPPVHKLVVYYNHGSGDSRGMVDFVHLKLVDFAKTNGHVVVQVTPRAGAPAELQAFYVGGQVRRHVCYRLDAASIEKHANYLLNSNAVGAKLVVEKEDIASESIFHEIPEFVRRRKTPRNQSNKFQNINLKTTGETDFKPQYWKHVKQTDWKTVGSPTDRKYVWPVLSGGQLKEHYWSPFNARETFKP